MKKLVSQLSILLITGCIFLGVGSKQSFATRSLGGPAPVNTYVPGNVVLNPDLSGGSHTVPPETITFQGPCNFKAMPGGYTPNFDSSLCWASIIADSRSGASTLVNPGTTIIPVANEGKTFVTKYAMYAANGNKTAAYPDGSTGTAILVQTWVVPRIRLNKAASGSLSPVATPDANITLYPGEHILDGSEGSPAPTTTRPYKWYFETKPGSGAYVLDLNCSTTKNCDHYFSSYGQYNYWLTAPYNGGYQSEDCPQATADCTRSRGVITVAAAIPTPVPTATPTPVPVITGVVVLYRANGTVLRCDAFWNGCPTVGDALYAKASIDAFGTPVDPSLSVYWNFGTGAIPTSGGSNPSTVFYYSTTGSKTVSFTTSDPNTRASTNIPQVLAASASTPTPTPTPTVTPTPTPINNAPTITEFSVSDTNPTVNSSITFTCTSTGNPTPSNTISFGDGTLAYVGSSPTHTYMTVGVFSASCVASNGVSTVGLTAQRNIGINVKAPPQSTWMLPSSANLAGANGAYYTTKLSIGNFGSTAASVDLKFLGHDADGTAGPVVTQNISSNASYNTDNVLASAFFISSGYGAIRISSASPSLNVTSQTSTPLVGGGTVGQSVPAIPYASFITFGGSKSLASLEESASYRTNLVVANTGLTQISVTGTLYGSDGLAMGSVSWTVPALGMIQVNRVVSAIAPGLSISNAMVVLSTSTPNGSFVAYASVIDNVTNDPRTVLPQ